MDDTVGLVIVKSNYLPVIPAFPGKTLVKTYRAMQFTRKTIVPSFLSPSGAGIHPDVSQCRLTGWIPAPEGDRNDE